MSKHRGMLAIVGLVALAAVSVVAAIQLHALLYGLPDPATADRDGLVRWLVLADLREHPPTVHRTLVDRFEEEFAESAELSADASTLDDGQIARVEENAELLKRAWFFARVNGYWSLGAAARPAFLDRQIDNIFRCAAIDRQFDASRGASAGDESDCVGSFFDSLSHWQSEAAAAERERIRQVVKAGLIRWLATHDLAAQPAAVRRQVVTALERELGDQLSFGDTTSSLAAAETARFWGNVELLAESWFYGKASEFAALEAARRPKFVASQLGVVDELVAHWPGAKQNGAADAMARLQRWIASAPDAQRAAAGEFARALQSAWLARRLGGLWQ